VIMLPEHLLSAQFVSGVKVTRSLVACVMLCKSLIVLLFFFFWLLCCQSFLDLQILIYCPISNFSRDWFVQMCSMGSCE